MKSHRVQSEICICNASGSTTVKKDTKKKHSQRCNKCTIRL